MFSALSPTSIQRGWALSAHKAGALSGALIRAGGWQGAFIAAAKAVLTPGGDSSGARTTRGNAMLNLSPQAAAQLRALARPFPAPLLGLKGARTRGVSVKGGSAALGGTPGVGSSPYTLQAGNSSPFKCVGSEAGSY